MDNTETIVIVFFSDEVLDIIAETNKVKVRLLDHGEAVQFKNYAEEMYEQFQARQKQYLMMKMFEEEIDID